MINGLQAVLFMLNAKINWFLLKINVTFMRKVGVFSCYEPESEENKKLGKISLFVQKFGKLKISESLNSNTAIQLVSLESNQVLLKSCRNRF